MNQISTSKRNPSPDVGLLVGRIFYVAHSNFCATLKDILYRFLSVVTNNAMSFAFIMHSLKNQIIVNLRIAHTLQTLSMSGEVGWRRGGRCFNYLAKISIRLPPEKRKKIKCQSQ